MIIHQSRVLCRYSRLSFGRVPVSLKSVKAELERLATSPQQRPELSILQENLEDYALYQRKSKLKVFDDNLRYNFAAKLHGYECVLSTADNKKPSYVLNTIGLGVFGLSLFVNLQFMIGYVSLLGHLTIIYLLYVQRKKINQLRRHPQILQMYLNDGGNLAINYCVWGQVSAAYDPLFESVSPSLKAELQQNNTGIPPSLDQSEALSLLTASQRQSYLSSFKRKHVSLFTVPKSDFEYGVIVKEYYTKQGILWCKVKDTLFWIRTDKLKINNRLFNQIL